MAGISSANSGNQKMDNIFLSKEIRMIFFCFVGMILISGTIAMGMGLTETTKNKIQQTIRNSEENKLSTIAVTTLPIITVIRDKIYNKDK